MYIRRIGERVEFTAGDNTKLREVFNPLKETLDLRYSFAVARVAPGQTTFLHRLRNSEVYHILGGTGEMRVDDEREAVAAGDVIYVPPLASQQITNTGSVDLSFVCIVDPAWKPEDEEILE
ncbi:MAG: cupin domain-containing protein [Candidatus Krumholzibacteriota bacterium]|nr:cupin domain-containing protein [Candidatus Krumholzibacteriota bacterium]